MKRYLWNVFAVLSILVFQMNYTWARAPRIDDWKTSSASSQNKRPLSILFVVGKFPVIAETTVLNQITGLIDRGQHVEIYAHERGNIKKMHADVDRYNLLDKAHFGEMPDLSNYDIIYCQFGPLGNEFAALKRKQKFKAKLVTCFRGFDITQYVHIHGAHVYKKLFATGDLFLPVCEYFKQLLIKCGCPDHKIRVQHSAIDCKRFNPAARNKQTSKEILILSVNRLVEKKGMYYAIRAMEMVIKRHPQVRYIIIGGGPLMKPLRRLVRRLGCKNNITLVGWCTHEQVQEYLKSAYAVVLASVTAADGNEEGIPNALKEALAMELPVVSTRHSGIPELVQDKVSGFLVAQADSNALAEKISYLVTHPEIAHDMGVAGRAIIESEFNVEKTNDHVLEMFRAMVFSF